MHHLRSHPPRGVSLVSVSVGSKCHDGGTTNFERATNLVSFRCRRFPVPVAAQGAQRVQFRLLLSDSLEPTPAHTHPRASHSCSNQATPSRDQQQLVLWAARTLHETTTTTSCILSRQPANSSASRSGSMSTAHTRTNPRTRARTHARTAAPAAWMRSISSGVQSLGVPPSGPSPSASASSESAAACACASASVSGSPPPIPSSDVSACVPVSVLQSDSVSWP